MKSTSKQRTMSVQDRMVSVRTETQRQFETNVSENNGYKPNCSADTGYFSKTSDCFQRNMIDVFCRVHVM